MFARIYHGYSICIALQNIRFVIVEHGDDVRKWKNIKKNIARIWIQKITQVILTIQRAKGLYDTVEGKRPD